jgi:farnesol dehydrogenase
VVRRTAAAGHEVRCLVREGSDRSALPAGVEVRTGDVTDLASYVEAAAGCEALLHVAGMVRLWSRDPRRFHLVNVGGVENAVRAAAEAGLRKVVVTSSIMALGPTNGREHDEGDFTPRERFGNAYEETKHLGAAAARRAAADGAPVVVLYPGVVYGPGPLSQANLVTGLLRSWLRWPVAPILDGGRPRWCLAYVEDVAEGHRLALEGAEPGSEYVLGGANLTLSEMREAAAEATGIRRPALPVPPWAARLAGVLELAGTLFGREPRQLTPGAVQVVRRDWAFSCERAARELGYRATPVREGLAATLEWMEGEGLIPAGREGA